MIYKFMKRTGMMLLAMLLVVGCVAFMPATEAKAATVATQSATAKITLEHAKASVYTGKSYTIKVKSVRGLKSRRVSFTSSNPQIATVNSKGRVKGMSRGKADITVTSAANSQVKTIFHITVKQQMTGLETASNMTLKKGKEVYLYYAVYPYNVNNQKLLFTSSNPEVVAVSKKGRLHAIEAGKAIIYVQSADGKYKKKVSITVKNKMIQETAIRLNTEKLTLVQGEKSRITAEIMPSTATAKNVYYLSSNVKVAKVSKTGVVTALSNGQAQITAYAADHSRVKAVCTVTVLDGSTTESQGIAAQADNNQTENQNVNTEMKAEEQKNTEVSTETAILTVSKDNVSFDIGDKTIINVEVTPASANKDFAWTSSNPEIASVSASGEITAVKAGRAIITVKNAEGASAQIKVQVSAEVQSPSSSGTIQALTMESDKDYQVRTGSYVQEYQATRVGEMTKSFAEMSTMNSLSKWFHTINNRNAAEYLLMFGYQPVIGINNSQIQVEDRFENNDNEKQIVISGTSKGHQAKVSITISMKSDKEITIQELVQVDGADTGSSSIDYSNIVVQSDYISAIMQHGSSRGQIQTNYLPLSQGQGELRINYNSTYMYGFSKDNNQTFWKMNKSLYATTYQDYQGRQALLDGPIETVLNNMKLFVLN